MSEKVCVGAIMGAFGVRGELRIKSFCADPAALDKYGALTSEDGTQTFKLKIARPVKGGFACRIKGVQYKDEADGLKGIRLYVDRDVLPNLPDDEFYHADLIGLEVVDTGGEVLGKIMAVHDHGAGDVLEITGKGIKGSALLPFTREAVPTVDLTAGRIIVDPPEGSLPEDKDDDG
ncbi:MAG: ribosome maturation factor RimM [Rhodobacteraceae bacterium]|nr:MAG: ribosome maturation factor RimM [Paracoccaceae bacterium]